MIEQIDLAGSFTLPGSAMTLNRMGYGAMQLAGRDGNKLVWGPPRDIYRHRRSNKRPDVCSELSGPTARELHRESIASEGDRRDVPEVGIVGSQHTSN
jgi:hypothetical protein